MKSKTTLILVVCGLALAAFIGIGLWIHSCNSGYFLSPGSVTTQTPTPPPTGATYEPYTVSWTQGADFTNGEFDGITMNPNGSQIQLGTGGQQNFQPTQICVAASGEDAIFLHKLDNPTEYIRVALPQFPTGGSVDPSRTAIDQDGNCWVAGRGNAGVYKVSKDGVLLGKVQLQNPNTPGTIGGKARAIAIDKNGFVWVGDCNNYVMWKISPGEDLSGNLTVSSGPYDVVKPNYLPGITKGGPYGAAVDSEGNLWVVGYKDNCDDGNTLSPGFISKIDTATGVAIATGETNVYGLVIDNNNYPWVGGWDGRTLNKINKDDLTVALSLNLPTITGLSGIHSRGVGTDTDGNIWVADSENDYLFKFDSNGTYKGRVTSDKGSSTNCQPVGVSGDPYGYVWAVNRACDSIAKISKDISELDPTNADKMNVYTTGDSPYTYSDMVGFGLFSTVLKNSGTWRVKFNSGYDEPEWTSVRWHAKVSEATKVKLRVRTSASSEGLDTATWTNYFETSPADLSGQVENLRWIQVEFYFYTLDQRYSPILDDFSLNFSLPTG